jgi:hypothetical protein
MYLYAHLFVNPLQPKRVRKESRKVGEYGREVKATLFLEEERA